jgi:hypothetical protein
MNQYPLGVSYLNGNFYTGGVPQMDTNNAFGQIAKQMNTMEYAQPLTNERLNKYYSLIGGAPSGQTSTQQQGAMTGNFPAALGNQFNKLSQNANDALYGGILGYQPKPISSPTGSTYSPPADQGFQFPYGLLSRNFFPGA